MPSSEAKDEVRGLIERHGPLSTSQLGTMSTLSFQEVWALVDSMLKAGELDRMEVEPGLFLYHLP
jgi:hypothetical protein